MPCRGASIRVTAFRLRSPVRRAEGGSDPGERVAQHDRELGVRFGLQPAFGGDPGCAGDGGGEDLGPELALATGAGAGRDRFSEGTLDRGDGVQELPLAGRVRR